MSRGNLQKSVIQWNEVRKLRTAKASLKTLTDILHSVQKIVENEFLNYLPK